jgi:hypothetical protein
MHANPNISKINFAFWVPLEKSNLARIIIKGQPLKRKGVPYPLPNKQTFDRNYNKKF